MNDPYRITDTPAGAARPTRNSLRTALWLVLILSAAANMALSTIAGNPILSSAFGLVALTSATALVVQHYRHRAR